MQKIILIAIACATLSGTVLAQEHEEGYESVILNDEQEKFVGVCVAKFDTEAYCACMAGIIEYPVIWPELNALYGGTRKEGGKIWKDLSAEAAKIIGEQIEVCSEAIK